MTPLDREDFAFLLANAAAGKALDPAYFGHLAQPVGILNYLRIANEIAAAVPAGQMLDWGAGLGQMTYLLGRRGFLVTAFDLGEPEPEGRPADAGDAGLPLSRGIKVVRTTHPTALPFADGAFDAALSCGVLEHVDEYSGVPGNELRSLAELRRVLRPGGTLFIYQLPQRWAWQEAVIRRFRLGYSHPRRYTEPEIRRMLKDAGFEVRRIRRANMVPKNLTGMPAAVRRLYNRWPRALLGADALLSAIPGANRLAGVLEVWAVRPG